jgi:phosphonoacetaldehyde hydrolase
MSASGRKFDLVVFDWAGTMVDFGCLAPVSALIQAFAQEGVALAEAAAREDMGVAKIDHVRALLAKADVRALWTEVKGRAPSEADVETLMEHLDPLMREAAAAASALIPGALETVRALRAQGIKIASSTGYTREMMGPVLAAAAEQGYAPDHLVCSGETPLGRPSPLMIYKACAELGVWPLSRVVKVDDSEAGVAEGRAAGCFTIGVAASGNTVGLSLRDWSALDHEAQQKRLVLARARLVEAGADRVIDTVAEAPEILGAVQSEDR